MHSVVRSNTPALNKNIRGIVAFFERKNIAQLPIPNSTNLKAKPSNWPLHSALQDNN